MTHHTEAELLRDIEEHMRKMWDARLLPAACWPTDLAQRLTQAARRAPSVPETIEQRAKKLKGLQVLIGATAGVPEAIELARSRFTEAYGRSPLHDDLAYACLLIDAYGGAPAAPVPLWDGKINPADFNVETFRRSGNGWLVKPDNCVRITHVPTGLFEEGVSERSIHTNKAEAWERLSARLEALAAAPEPPDAFQTEGGLKSEIRTTSTAPVQMPEPVGVMAPWPLDPSRDYIEWANESPARGTALYTEPQVRQLLSAHGIKGA